MFVRMATNEDESAVPQDLALLFTTNSSDFTAEKIFIGRDEERRAFDLAVATHHAHSNDPEFDSQDVEAPRRNVQVFHGAAGVGKSTLSRALEQRHAGAPHPALPAWPVMRQSFRTSVVARLDLASESGVDLERSLLLIRAATARLGRPMYAFDLALSRYWEQVHPDQSLSDFVRGDRTLGRASEILNLPDQIQEGLKEIAQALGSSSTVIAVASQLSAILLRSFRKKRTRRHAVQGCRRLQALLEAEANIDSLSYYPHLLAWDLGQLSKRLNGSFHVTVFLDTFEDVTQETNRNFEKCLHRMIWLMPNVLFVVTGRNRLPWGEPGTGRFGRDDAQAWPGLAVNATTEPTQHQLANLSEVDCLRYLERRLQSDGRPFIPLTVRVQIAHDSEGLPLFLDMAITRYLQIASTGRSPAPTDFAGGFPELLHRVLRDLSFEERRLTRVLSLLDSFDIDLAVAAGGLQSEAAAINLSRRTFVEHDQDAPFPYSIHRLIRQELRNVTNGPDSFTSADWSRHAQQVFDKLGERYHWASRSGDRSVANSVLNQALRLADEYHLELGWCVDAAYLFIEDSLWEGSVRPLIGPELATPAAALAQTLLAVGNRRAESRRETSREPRGDLMFSDLRQTADALNEVLTAGLLVGEARDLATYYAAETLRELGNGAESERLIRSIAGHTSRMAGIAAKGLVHRLRRLGRFGELRDLIAAQPAEAVWLQMSGTLSWSQGLLEQAEREYTAGREMFLAAGYLGNADELLGSLIFVRGLGGDRRPENVAFVVEGVQTMHGSRNVWATLMADLGAALLDADGSAELASRNLSISREGAVAGLTSIQSYAHLSLCLNAALSEDPQALAQSRTRLSTQISAEDFHWLLEIVDFWSDSDLRQSTVEPAELQSPVADWFDGEQAARERWRDILHRHQPGTPASTT